jgi:hypothetical protein
MIALFNFLQSLIPMQLTVKYLRWEDDVTITRDTLQMHDVIVLDDIIAHDDTQVHSDVCA